MLILEQTLFLGIFPITEFPILPFWNAEAWFSHLRHSVSDKWCVAVYQPKMRVLITDTGKQWDKASGLWIRKYQAMNQVITSW